MCQRLSQQRTHVQLQQGKLLLNHLTRGRRGSVQTVEIIAARGRGGIGSARRAKHAKHRAEFQQEAWQQCRCGSRRRSQAVLHHASDGGERGGALRAAAIVARTRFNAVRESELGLVRARGAIGQT